MPDIKDAEAKLKGTNKQEKVIAEQILRRCREDRSMLEDVLKPEKTFKDCIQYIRHQAQEKATNGWYMAEDSEVFEWAEDYFRKAEPEKKQGTKKKAAAPLENDKKEKPKNGRKIAKSVQKMPKTKAEKPKKKSKENDDGEIEGQMSIFDFM